MKVTSIRKIAGAGAMLFLLGIAPPGVHPFLSPAVAYQNDGSDVMTTKIKDLQLALVVVNEETNFEELKKIGGAFATTYRAKRAQVYYKNPNKARFDTKVLGATASIIFNGDDKKFKTPLGSKKMSTAGQPGQKQSLLDLGIFAKDFLSTDYAPTLLRTEKGLLVYKLSQRGTDNKSHEIVWVNPKTAIMERRQTFNGDDKLQKEIRYVKPKLFPGGIYVPTRVEVYNQYGKLGAVQNVEDIKVNAGIDDSKFDTL